MAMSTNRTDMHRRRGALRIARGLEAPSEARSVSDEAMIVSAQAPRSATSAGLNAGSLYILNWRYTLK